MFTENVAKVVERVGEILGSEYSVGATQMPKNNGVVFTAITIMEAGSAVQQRIFLDKDGENVEQAAQDIAEKYKESKRSMIDTKTFFNKEYILQNVKYQVVGLDTNKDRLETLVHKEFLDMAATYRVPIDTFSNDEEEGSIVLTGANIGALDITFEELDQAAAKNISESEVVFDSMMDVLMSFGSVRNAKRVEECKIKDDDMYVLTNSNAMHGAAQLMHKELWKRLAESAETDLVILPSSIHELIVLKDNGKFTPDEMKDIVHSVNESDAISDIDILTDNVYRWSRKKGRLEIA